MSDTTTRRAAATPRRSRAMWQSRATLLACALSLVGTPPLQAQDCKSQGLDPLTFRRVLHQSFSSLLGSTSKGVPGSYAAVDIKDAAATIASTTVLRRGVAIAVKANGGVSDGILAVINDQTLSSKFGAEVSVHFLGGGRRAIQFDQDSCVAYYGAIRKAEEQHAIRDVEIQAKYQRVLQRSELAALDKRLAEMETAIAAATVPAIKDSLQVEVARARALRQQVEQRDIPDDKAQRQASGNQRARELVKARAGLDVVGFAFGWWSIGYGVENTSFRLFDPARAAGEQIGKKAFASQGVTLTYSRYAMTEIRNATRFWSIGARAGWEDNLGSLTKVELTDRKQYGTAPNDRIAEAKYTAYQGEYEKKIGTVRVNGDHYRFFLADNQGALHLFPAVRLRDGARPAYSMGTGFLLTARRDAESFLNAELYFNLTDLTDSQESELDFWGRSELGLRLSFPISFSPRA